MVPYLFPSSLLSRDVIRRVRGAVPLVALAASLAASIAPARADEWSVVPTGDPIYRQLAVIDQFGDGKATKTPKGLTRYEAALQVARTLTFSGSEASKLPRTGWRALRDLTLSLRPELTQLGIDVNAALATCDKNLAAPASKPSNAASASLGGVFTPGGPLGVRALDNPLVGSTGMRSPLMASSGTAQQDAALGLKSSSFQMPLSQRLRLNAATLTLGQKGQRSLTGNVADRNLATSTGIAYDLTSWMTVHGGTTQRSLGGDPSQALLFNSPFFNGATEARGAGGGLDVNLGRLSLSGGVETLGTNNGERGTLTTGGVGLSPWDRLSLSAKLSVLRSAESNSPISTGTEVGVGLNVTRRLHLNLLYQNMFTQQNASNSSRFSGGVSMSF